MAASAGVFRQRAPDAHILGLSESCIGLDQRQLYSSTFFHIDNHVALREGRRCVTELLRSRVFHGISRRAVPGPTDGGNHGARVIEHNDS